MNLQELQQTDWYISRPEIIKEAINILPPTELYHIRDSAWQCYIVSYEEPLSGKLEDVTITIQKTGISNKPMLQGLDLINTNQVFGLSLNDLELYFL